MCGIKKLPKARFLDIREDLLLLLGSVVKNWSVYAARTNYSIAYYSTDQHLSGHKCILLLCLEVRAGIITLTF